MLLKSSALWLLIYISVYTTKSCGNIAVIWSFIQTIQWRNPSIFALSPLSAIAPTKLIIWGFPSIEKVDVNCFWPSDWSITPTQNPQHFLMQTQEQCHYANSRVALDSMLLMAASTLRNFVPTPIPDQLRSVDQTVVVVVVVQSIAAWHGGIRCGLLQRFGGDTVHCIYSQ